MAPTSQSRSRAGRSSRRLDITVTASSFDDGWDKAHLENRIYVRRSSFRATPSTFVSVLGWNRDADRFEDDLLLIPSGDIASLARDDGEWMVLELEPGGVRHRRLDGYRTSLARLARTLEAMLSTAG